AVRFLGRSHRQPTIRALAEIGLLGEAQHILIEAQGFLLIVHVYAGHSDFHFHSPFSSSRFAPRRFRSCFPSRRRWLIHPVQVALESIYMSRPEPTELSQPVIQFPKWLRLQSVETSLCIHGGLHKAGLAQHPQVLRDGRLRHSKLTLDLSY